MSNGVLSLSEILTPLEYERTTVYRTEYERMHSAQRPAEPDDTAEQRRLSYVSHITARYHASIIKEV